MTEFEELFVKTKDCILGPFKKPTLLSFHFSKEEKVDNAICNIKTMDIINQQIYHTLGMRIKDYRY